MKQWVFIVLFSLPVVAFSQEKSDGGGETNHKKRVEELKETKERQEYEQKQAEEKLKEYQYDIQDKKTKKRMKANRKKANNYNQGKKKSFLSGWFKPKR